MSTSLVITELVVVLISLFVFTFNILIYKKTTGGSKAYYFWALASTVILIGALISFISSFFMDPNKVELKGIAGFIEVIHLSFTLMGYYYIALGAVYLPGELKITNVNLEKYVNLRKIVLLGIIIWSSFVTMLLVIITNKIPVRMFYVPFFAIAWIYSFYNLLPFYKTVKNDAKYWIYLLLAAIFGFLGNLDEIISYFIFDELIILKPIFYGIMGISFFLGFYKLGKDLQAF